MIGIANQWWVAVLLACAGWTLIACGLMYLTGSYDSQLIEFLRAKAQNLRFGSAVLSYWEIEAKTVFFGTALAAFPTYWIHIWFWP